MVYDLQKKYKKEVIPEMKKKFGYKNALAVPKIEKVVLNSGVGSVKEEERKKHIKEKLAFIAGQAVSARPAKKAIASFKTRRGNIVGYSVTLRGKRMFDFLSKLIFAALARQRDFRGLSPKLVDGSGNLTISFREHLVFPEMVREDIKNAFGLSVTIVTAASTKNEALELLKLMGFPFKKNG
jgi:large subunit ribosomal protein L5